MCWHHCHAWSPSPQPFQSPPVSRACASHESRTCPLPCTPPTLAALSEPNLALRTAGIAQHRRNLLQVNSAHQVHLSAVDLKDLKPALYLTRTARPHRLVRVRELDLAIDAAGPEQRGVQNVNAVGGHDDLDAIGGLEAVQLVQQLHHRSLHLVLAAVALAPRAADAVDLVHEDQARLVLSAGQAPSPRLPGADEQLAHHARALANVLLYQLRTAQTNEGTVRVVGHRARQQRLARARRAVKQHALGLLDAQRLEELGMLEGQLDHLLHFRDLLVQTAAHVVGAVGDLLHLHQTHDGIHLGGHDLRDLVGVGMESHTCIWFQLIYGDALVNIDNGLRVLGAFLNREPEMQHSLSRWPYSSRPSSPPLSPGQSSSSSSSVVAAPPADRVLRSEYLHTQNTLII